MLVWLDNIANHRDATNENYARELLELYSMGIGTYSQDDVVGAARAFTGWTVRVRSRTAEFYFNPADHDFGSKTFLGRSGALDRTDIVDIICRQEVTPRFIARRMWTHLAGNEAPEAVLDRLADAYNAHDHSLLEMFRALFTAPDFLATAHRPDRFKNPVEHTCGLLRQLEASVDGSSVGPALTGQGMTLYDPTNPSGWTEGAAWMTTATLLLRFQIGSALGLAAEAVVDLLAGIPAEDQPPVTYPESALAQDLATAARLLAGGLGARVVWVATGGYDTHAGQAATHATLLADLAQCLASFQSDPGPSDSSPWACSDTQAAGINDLDGQSRRAV